MRRTAEGDIYDAGVRRCFLDAVEDGGEAEMTSELRTPEGGTVIEVIRVYASGKLEIFRDTSHDSGATGGWTRAECGGVRVVGSDPVGTPIFVVDDCSDPEELPN